MRRFNDIYLFLHVARCGSFTAAARQLGLSKSALSQNIANLEDALGLRLFNRSTRSLALTAAGERLLAASAAPFAAIEAGLERLREDSDGVPVRINAPQLACEWILLPKLRPLLAANPHLRVEITVDNRFVDIVGEGYDLGVRLGDEVAKDMVALRISPPLTMTLVASPPYLHANPPPQTMDDLPQHRLIGLRLRHADGALLPWELTVDGERREYRPAAQVVVNQNQKQAALAHLGIAQVSLPLVADELARGALVEVLPACAVAYPPLYAYYPNRKGHPAALAQVLAALREA
ncbi:LysR family transcriptional regulator [uncultured Cardiobacterium sp.]|uniref:LysR family transcriptional regulator n=1 Tax=uncultured Cardiobacterium sp. TaxID=417619 RepID=UPI00261B0BE2|nr:LysR family transcriptional regulator [uncultured Cardiobacterium sp.]